MRVIRSVLKVIAGSVLSLAVSGGAAAATDESYPIAVLRGLNKITARVTTMVVPVGETVNFGTLRIKCDVCQKHPPEESPESAAFLEIVEERSGQAPEKVFSGWMFASSPGLSSLQHPIYDVWVLDCVNNTPSADSSASPGGSP
jgi:hypothetical protein